MCRFDEKNGTQGACFMVLKFRWRTLLFAVLFAVRVGGAGGLVTGIAVRPRVLVGDGGVLVGLKKKAKSEGWDWNPGACDC